ncbi:CE112 protein, partial [Rhinopomastus cyanomelas]|nr:CE112 protein [Rhinopomastus cyanomelas]
DHHHKKPISLDDSDLEARLNSWNLGIENPRYLREKPLPVSLMTSRIDLGQSSSLRDERMQLRMREREVDMKVKIVEGRFHEEKLKLQQKHDADIQKILDRKNEEIEALKTLHKNQQHEAEETIRNLEKKVQNLIRESQGIRQVKDEQIAELKKMCEQSSEFLNNEWEKKLHNVVAEMEKDKFNSQKKYTEDMQKLTEDTNARLNKMEEDYLKQIKSANQKVKILEARVQQLTVEAENSNLQRKTLSQEKAELEQRYQAVRSELQSMKARHSSLQKDKDHIIQDYEKNIQQLQSKHDVDISFIKQEHALEAAKASGTIEELEHAVSVLKQQLQDSEHRQQQLRDQEFKLQQDKRVYENQIQSIRNDLDKAQKKISKLEEVLREKEEQLTRVTEVQRLKAQQADDALEEFRRQVELNSEKVYAEMKQQIEKAEADLSKAKSLRETQTKEYSRQLETLKQQMLELKLEHEHEKTHLFQQHNAEKDCLVRDHEQEIKKLEKEFGAAMAERESKTQECRMRDAQVICDLENQIHKLKEKLIHVKAQQKQQLQEQLEEEKRRTAEAHDASLREMKAETEKLLQHMKKIYAAQIDKANSRLRQTEEECAQKVEASSQIITDLNTTISSLTEENSRQQLATEQQFRRAQKLEHEKQQLIADYDKIIKALQDEVESCRSLVEFTEKKLQAKELETFEQVTRVQQEYESKFRGMVPASTRQHLEDTIVSLKSQVNPL